MYNSNFDNSAFKKKAIREYNRTIDDPCYLQQQTDMNAKKLKFVTTNNIDLLEGKDKFNYFGINIKDKLAVPSESMKDYSKLVGGSTGNIITNCGGKIEIGQLPIPTMPSKYQLYHGDIYLEDTMKNQNEVRKQTTIPRDSYYYNRSFYIFDNMEKPNPIKSVEIGNRVGIPTRNLTKAKGAVFVRK